MKYYHNNEIFDILPRVSHFRVWSKIYIDECQEEHITINNFSNRNKGKLIRIGGEVNIKEIYFIVRNLF